MIDYSEWAKRLLEEIYYAPEDHRESVIEDHLKKAAARGYTDGADNGWWHEMERESYHGEDL